MLKNVKRRFNKIMSLLLAAAMIISIFNLPVLAEEASINAVAKCLILDTNRSNGKVYALSNRVAASYQDDLKEKTYYGFEAREYEKGDPVTEDMLWTITWDGDNCLIKSGSEYLYAEQLESGGVLGLSDEPCIWTYKNNKLYVNEDTNTYLAHNLNTAGFQDVTDSIISVLNSNNGDRIQLEEYIDEVSYYVDFEMCGHGKDVSDQILGYGEKVVKPQNPSEEGSVFEGWFADSEYTTEFDFNTEIEENTVIYAKWKELYYDVSFDMQGHGQAVDTQSIRYGHSVEMPGYPQDDDFVFIGWYKDYEFNNEFDFDEKIYKDTTVYARWERKTDDVYTVTFEPSDIIEVDSQNIKCGNSITKPSDPVVNGYKFAGWYTDKSYLREFDFDRPVIEDVTVYAKMIRLYVVTFSSDHGNQIKSQTISEGGYVSKPAAPVDENWDFDGWFTDNTYSTVYDFSSSIKSNTTIYAKWTRLYNVSYEMNGHGTAYDSVKVREGATINRPEEEPVEKGWIFGGFYADYKCTTEFDFDKGITADTVIYVKWADNTATIKYDLGGHGDKIPSESVVKGSTATRPEDPVEEGYEFDGWYVDDQFTTEFDFKTQLTVNTTVYAKWCRVYKLTYELNGHGSEIAADYVRTDSVSVKPEDPSAKGWKFIGWYADQAFTKEFKFGTSLNEDTKIYAKWEDVLFTVSFVMNGYGTAIPSQEINKGECVVAPAVPKEDGKDFLGWYSDIEFKELYDFDTPVTKDLKLYAKWSDKAPEPDKYTVKFEMNVEGVVVLDQTVIKGELVDKPEDPELEGYDFDGWYADQKFTEVFNFENTFITKNTTIYAKWTKIVTVKFDMGEHGQKIDSITVRSGSTISEPAMPVENGWVFVGWYDDDTYKNKYDFSKAVKADTTIYAKWKKGDLTYVSYQTHVQSIGWQDYVADGLSSGTEGKSLRLEAIRIKLSDDLEYKGSISYSTHVQNYGWMPEVSDGKLSGTSGESKRLEAIRIKLTGDIAEHYDVYYRVHAQNFGWLGWAKNGVSAGTAGYSYRLESIQIRLVKKGEKAPGSTICAFVENGVGANNGDTNAVNISYTTHVQNVGWQNYVSNGYMAGTSGQSLRLEGIKIAVSNDSGIDGEIEYSTHIQGIGWQDYVKENELSGTNGQSRRLEAIKIRLTGELGELYDIYYRVHAQNFGWLGWARNDEIAGTAGYSYRLEGIQIILVPKGEDAPGDYLGIKGDREESYSVKDNEPVVDNLKIK